MLPPMDEDKNQNHFGDWMERYAHGRKVLDAMSRFRHYYYRHVDRYHGWNETYYRCCTWLVAAAAVLMVLAALAGTSRAGLHHYRHYQEKCCQKEAQAFLAHGDYHNAALSARKALVLNPNNVPACRVMSELADRSHSPQALEWMRRIVQNEPTVGNKLILASAGLKYQKPPFPLTVQILDELALTATNSARYQMVAGGLAMQTHCLVEGEAHFEAAAKLEPTNGLFRMNIAILRLVSTNKTEQVQSRAILEKMGSDESIGPLALRILVADRLLHKDAAAANIYSSQLVASPHAILADQLQNLEILQQLKSDEFNDRLQTVQQQVATNALAVEEVSAWMQANGLVAESLDWLTGLTIPLLDQRPVQMALAQGYLQSSQWTALLNIASQANWGDLEFLRLALVFRAWSQLGAAGAADSNWNAAMGEAAGRHEAMTQLLQLAESWHLQQKQEAVLLQMVQEFPEERRARQELELLYFNSGNTLGLHQLYLILNAHFPDETAYKNNLTATALLLKIDVRKACQWAAEVYAKNPGDPIAASTYAFALHMQGRDKQGLAVLQKFQPAELAQPSVALYYGVLLAATGKADEAMPWLQMAQTKGHLLPEEQELLSIALGKGQAPRP
jgi:tetratricopeptide (TPR) repeat protein